MSSKPWIAPVAGGVAFLFIFLLVALDPAAAGRFAKGVSRAALPSPLEQSAVGSFVETSVDDAVRAFSLGDPDKLIEGDLRLASTASPVGQWLPSRTLTLRWTDLGSSAIRYEVRYGPPGSTYESATVAAPAALSPQYNLTLPQDGPWYVWVRPRTEDAGRVSSFGPFLVDGSSPAPPSLQPRDNPPGYRFMVTWTGTQDVSGISNYELQRRLAVDGRTADSGWEAAALAAATSHEEDQLGNGLYEYRLRATNGAGLASNWSNLIQVQVAAPMSNPGPGDLDYGIQVNYTSFIRIWDLSNPSLYLGTDEIPASIASPYLAKESAIETDNATLRQIVAQEIGTETNTLEIALDLFEYLFDHADYDEEKLTLSEGERDLQSAGTTLDRGKGICGDLAVLYITLLRIAGVPARPVHGYLDNARSGVGGFHMWVEVYVGPADSARPWLTVDVSGITGPYQEELLFAYFGHFNPDYLALGNELNYDRHADGQWNTWARFRWANPSGAARPELVDDAEVHDFGSEYGRLFFNTANRRSEFLPCQSPNLGNPGDPCPDEPAPAGYNRYFVVKGISHKVIDYGANLERNLPACLKVELRYPFTDAYGAVVPDQSAIYKVYEGSSSSQVQVGSPDADGWVTFTDGTNTGQACSDL